MAYEIKELSVGGVLDQAIKVLKDNFALLFGVIAVVYLPFNLIGGALVSYFMGPTLELMKRTPPDEVLPLVAQIYGMLAPLFLLNLLFVYPLTTAAVIYAAASRYLDIPVTVKSAVRKGLTLIVPLILTNILWYLAVMGGSFLCLIPGIIFAFWFFLCNHVAVIEGKWGSAALSRSRQLMKGNAGTLFILGFMLFVIQAAISGMTNLLQPLYLQMAVSTIILSLVYVFTASVYVVFYFSCRCKHENFDLQMLAEAVTSDEGTA